MSKNKAKPSTLLSLTQSRNSNKTPPPSDEPRIPPTTPYAQDTAASSSVVYNVFSKVDKANMQLVGDIKRTCSVNIRKWAIIALDLDLDSDPEVDFATKYWKCVEDKYEVYKKAAQRNKGQENPLYPPFVAQQLRLRQWICSMPCQQRI